MIAIEGLRFGYPRSDFVLRVENLKIEKGEIVALVGPSGCGKTTLLHLIAGIKRPLAGKVSVDGTEPASLSESARRDFRLRRIGLVFQDFALIDYLSVLDNILIPYRIGHSLRLNAAVRERAGQLAARLGIGDTLKRNIGQLSHGERQRVAACRALLPKPPLLLADEPTGNLDPTAKDKVMQALIAAVRAEGSTLLTVTHDRDLLGSFERVIDFKDFRELA